MSVSVGDENGKSRNVANIWIGDENDKARKVNAGYIGVNGKANRFYNANGGFRFTVKDYLGIGIAVDEGDVYVDYGDGNGKTISGYEQIDYYYSDSDPHQVVISGKLTQLSLLAPYNILTIDSVFPKMNSRMYGGAFDGFLQNAELLESIPKNLFDNYANVASSFEHCFNGCRSLTHIPDGLFDKLKNPESFRWCFAGCTSLTGNAPELWDSSKYPTVLMGDGCFEGCSGLTNYADIPSDWK